MAGCPVRAFRKIRPLVPGWKRRRCTCLAVSSIVLLVGLRRVFKGWLMGVTVAGDNASDLDEFLGKPVTVVAAIPADGVGKVEFKGASWNAQCPDALSTGAAAVITGRDGLCLLVRAK